MASREAQLVDLQLIIETPENVVLAYPLAGPAPRLAAYAVDFVLRAVVLAFAFIFLNFVIGIVAGGLSAGLSLLLMFLMNWFYYVICEGCFRGRTPGKWLFSLRVVQEQGFPISFWSACLRNMLRAVDSLPLYGIGWITMLFAGKFRRLGDLAARTVVIEERQVYLPRQPLVLERMKPLPREEVGPYVPPSATLALIEDFLTRRYVLTHRRGHEMALVLSRALAKKLNYSGDPRQVLEFPMAFLARVFVTYAGLRGGSRRAAESEQAEVVRQRNARAAS